MKACFPILLILLLLLLLWVSWCCVMARVMDMTVHGFGLCIRPYSLASDHKSLEMRCEEKGTVPKVLLSRLSLFIHRFWSAREKTGYALVWRRGSAIRVANTPCSISDTHTQVRASRTPKSVVIPSTITKF